MFGKPWRTVEGTAVACQSTSLAIKKWVISKEIPMPAAITSFTKVVIAKNEGGLENWNTDISHCNRSSFQREMQQTTRYAGVANHVYICLLKTAY